MSTIDITNIKTRLALYGVTFENYKDETGNLTGNVKIPAKLFIHNTSLTAEEAFYLVANKVFWVANLKCLQVPGKFTQNWKEVVGEQVFDKFRRAIYEEVNRRFLSNTFPEFSAGETLVPNSMSLQGSGIIGTDSVDDYFSHASRAMFSNIHWMDINPNDQYREDLNNNLMYVNCSNLSLSSKDYKSVLCADETGKFLRKKLDYFASEEDFEPVKEDIENITTQVAQNTSDISELSNEYSQFVTQDQLKKLLTGFPKNIVEWNSSTTYTPPQLVIHDGRLWWCLKENNLNHVPGGTDLGWWEQIVDSVIDNSGGEIVFQAGTNIIVSYTNPNTRIFIDINKVLNNLTSITEATIYNEIKNQLPSEVIFTLEDCKNFIKNFCGSADNFYSHCIRLNFKNSILFHSGEIKVFYNYDNIQKFADNYGISVGNDFEVLPENYFISSANITNEQPIYNATGLLNVNNLPTDKFTTVTGGEHTHALYFYYGTINYESDVHLVLTLQGKTTPHLTADIAGHGNTITSNNTQNISSYDALTNTWHPTDTYWCGGYVDSKSSQPAKYHPIGLITGHYSAHNHTFQLNTTQSIFTNNIPQLKLIFIRFTKDVTINNIYVNAIDIQSTYTVTNSSINLDKYLLKVTANELLAKKIDKVEDTDGLIPSGSEDGNLNYDSKYTTTLLSSVSNKLEMDPTKWSSETIEAIANILRNPIMDGGTK